MRPDFGYSNRGRWETDGKPNGPKMLGCMGSPTFGARHSAGEAGVNVFLNTLIIWEFFNLGIFRYVAVLVYLVGVMLLVVTTPFWLILIRMFVTRCLAYPKSGIALRVTSLILLSIGFCFDLLGS